MARSCSSRVGGDGCWQGRAPGMVPPVVAAIVATCRRVMVMVMRMIRIPIQFLDPG